MPGKSWNCILYSQIWDIKIKSIRTIKGLVVLHRKLCDDLVFFFCVKAKLNYQNKYKNVEVKQILFMKLLRRRIWNKIHEWNQMVGKFF